jgi:hypothetical protein
MKPSEVVRQRLRRAVAQGYRTMAYHATPENFQGFDTKHAGKQLNTVISRAGLNFTTDKATVNQYAEFFADKGGYPQIIPVLLKMKKTFVMDFRSPQDMRTGARPKALAEMGLSEMGAKVQWAQRQGYDSVWMKNFRHYLPLKNNTLLYSLSDLIIVFHPNQVRSIFGNFADDKQDSTDLMDSRQWH